MITCYVHITSEGHCLPRPIHFTNYVYWKFLRLHISFTVIEIYIYIVTLITCYTGHVLTLLGYVYHSWDSCLH